MILVLQNVFVMLGPMFQRALYFKGKEGLLFYKSISISDKVRGSERANICLSPTVW